MSEALATFGTVHRTTTDRPFLGTQTLPRYHYPLRILRKDGSLLGTMKVLNDGTRTWTNADSVSVLWKRHRNLSVTCEGIAIENDDGPILMILMISNGTCILKSYVSLVFPDEILEFMPLTRIREQREVIVTRRTPPKARFTLVPEIEVLSEATLLDMPVIDVIVDWPRRGFIRRLLDALLDR